MANQTKKTHAGGGLYIALAICILSVLCIGIYSAIINIFDPGVISDPQIEEQKNPSPTVTRKEPVQNTPIVTESPNVNVDSSSPEEEPEHDVSAVPSLPGYTMPVSGEMIWGFSDDVLVYSETMNDYRLHNGVDIAANLGTPVKAFTDGIVLEVYEDPLMGQTVILDHGNEIQSIYQNLSSQLPEEIKVGAVVEEGQVIGGVGETTLIECAQEPHLHFSVTVAGNSVDPMEYFK